MWAGTMLYTPDVYTTELCECVGVVSSMKFRNSLTLSALVLFGYPQNVRALVSHLVKTNF